MPQLASVHGYKTYLTSAAMFLVGVVFLFAAGQMTWESPGAGVEAAVRRVVGWLLITQAVSSASIRHAIAGLRGTK